MADFYVSILKIITVLGVDCFDQSHLSDVERYSIVPVPSFMTKWVSAIQILFSALELIPSFYTPVEDGTYYGITRGGPPGGWAGGWRPVLCPEHISKTTLARVMKFYGWIDLIQGSAVRRNHNSCSLNF